MGILENKQEHRESGQTTTGQYKAIIKLNKNTKNSKKQKDNKKHKKTKQIENIRQ